MSRPRHPHSEIEAALAYAEDHGWTIEKRRGHAWGVMLCPVNQRGGCRQSIYSTPRSPTHHARHLRRAVDRCPHCEET